MNEKLKIGDIVHFKLNFKGHTKLNMLLALQRLFDEGKSNHVGIYAGNNNILEMMMDCKIRYIGDLQNDRSVAIQRVNMTYNQDQMKNFLDVFYAKNKGKKYDYPQLALTGFTRLAKWYFGKMTKKKKNLPAIDLSADKFICSELVSDFYKDMGVKLQGLSEVPTPNEIFYSPSVYIVKNFGQVM